MDQKVKKIKRKTEVQVIAPSRADSLDNSALQTDMFPPAPVATTKQPTTSHEMMSYFDTRSTK